MYKLIISKKSEKFLNKISNSDKSLFNQLINALDEISVDPLKGKALAGNLKGYYSYRMREYRIIYEIENKILHVYIEKIAHRRESYQQ